MQNKSRAFAKLEKQYPELLDNKWYIFGVYCLLNVLVLFIFYDIIVTDPKYYTGGNDNSVRLFRNIWSGLYLLNPLYSFIKFFFVAVIMDTVAKIFFKLELGWKPFFLLYVLGSFILLLPNLAAVIWFLLLNPNYHMSEVREFHFLHIFNLFPDGTELKASTYTLLNYFNIPEVLFWLVMSYGAAFLLKEKLKKGVVLVFSTLGLMVFSYTAMELVFYISIGE